MKTENKQVLVYFSFNIFKFNIHSKKTHITNAWLDEFLQNEHIHETSTQNNKEIIQHQQRLLPFLSHYPPKLTTILTSTA